MKNDDMWEASYFFYNKNRTKKVSLVISVALGDHRKNGKELSIKKKIK